MGPVKGLDAGVQREGRVKEDGVIIVVYNKVGVAY